MMHNAKLREQAATVLTNASISSKNNLFASYMLLTGGIVKVIGFTLTAIANQIKANNT